MATPTYHTGDHVRSLVHRHGVLPITPGDVGTVTGSGLRNYIEPYVLVLMQVADGAVHTSFGPDEIAAVR
jgi:hypothetical protein